MRQTQTTQPGLAPKSPGVVTILLYGGSVALDYEDSKHRYSINDIKLAGTTSITGIVDKPQLISWAVKLAIEVIRRALRPGVALDEVEIVDLLKKAQFAHRDKKDSAGTIGSLVHDWCERHIQAILEERAGPAMPSNPSVLHGVNAFLQWERDHKVEYIFSERKVVSIKHWFAGTLDILAVVDGKLTLVDLKTSGGVYEEYWLQTAGYCIAFHEEHPDERIEQRLILHLDKETGNLAEWNCETEVPVWKYGEGIVRVPRPDPQLSLGLDIDGFLGLRAAFRRLKGA